MAVCAFTTLAVGAACGPAQKERDEANQTVVAQDVHSARDAGMGTIDAPTTSPGAQVSVGTPRPDDGAGFWVSAHTIRASGVSSELRPATLPGAGHAPGGLYVPSADSGDINGQHSDVEAVPATSTDSIQRFTEGYLGAAGSIELLGHLIEVVIPCEYGWGEYVKVNYYESRAQFDPQSWQTAGGGDPADDFQVGANVARWIALIGDPGGSGGWGCW